jgi:hypothetical protein
VVESSTTPALAPLFRESAVKKIPSLFARDPSNPRVISDDYHPLADWVVRGEGVATRKWDGTAILIKGGQLYARFEAKHGKQPPPDFVPAQDPDPATGDQPGWVPAIRREDCWIREAYETTLQRHGSLKEGTYEACGPKIAGNPEHLTEHQLIRHGSDVLDGMLSNIRVPRDKAGLIAFFSSNDIEGVVWWRQIGQDDCDKIKITGKALGVRRSQS